MTKAAPSRFEEVETLGELSEFNAAVRPAKEALRFEGRSSSYGELDSRANQVANGLRDAGLEPGARGGFLGKNSDQCFEVVFGCAKSGTVLVGLNWRLASQDMAYILNDSRAEFLFVAPEFWGLAA